jgi:hypothetical protein
MITAAQLDDWADTAPAQADLPRLIRRLVHAAASTTQIAFPAGDSVVLPGFDGEMHSEEGNAWIPNGHSRWEVSCRKDVGTKANEDFEKRAADARSNCAYVAVTARRWPGKARWQREKAAAGHWKDVRAYDADDLEQWLEQSPAVALAFAEELGLVGPGVESLASYVNAWGEQCSPAITADALLTGRGGRASELVGRVKCALAGKVQSSLAVRADSVQEAVAFVAAALCGDPTLAASALVVSSVDGWRFVAKNPGIRIAVAATPEIAEAPPSRAGLAIIVPYASGDLAQRWRSVEGQRNESELSLERVMHSEFEKALQLIGLDENDTRRLSTQCGRSWSVFRRQHATNPAIRRPAWLDHRASGALATVCLAGTWSSEREVDKEIVSRIAGRTYAEVEADLLELERLDDSPLLHIGSVWKAKSALELLALFGERVGTDALDRFFCEVETILTAVDPQLELPDGKRYAAGIYGKVRPTSDLLLWSLCDTLIKLAVRGPELPSLTVHGVSTRVDQLVRTLLRGADRVRWLSLFYELPALAEASPHEFLSAVEEGIAHPDGGARAVLLETQGSGLVDRCWHAGMLWALETLAWHPNRLQRVSLILARLSDIRIEGNWANTPTRTLLSLYRTWFPQTAATIEQRIEALDFLIERAPGPAYALLDSLTGTGLEFAMLTARPKWRDDDAGAGYGATGLERDQMMVAAIDRQIRMAKDKPARIAKLVGKYATLDDPRQHRVRAMLAECRGAGDAEKEELRRALRRKLHWHRNHDDKRDDAAALGALLDPLDDAYAALEPEDLIVRHAWLFQNGWVELPIRTRDDNFQEQSRRKAEFARLALRDIFDARGWAGVLTLATGGGEARIVGLHLPHVGLPREELERWIAENSGDLRSGEVPTLLAGAILCSLTREDRAAALDAIFALADQAGRGAEWKTRLLILCPHDPAIWRWAEALDQSALFWSNCSADLFLDNADDKAIALRTLVANQRPASALSACHIDFSPYDPELVFQMLDGIRRGHEISENCLPREYVFQHAIDHLEESGGIDEMRLAQLEFALIRALGFEGERHAKSLYHVLMSQPEVMVDLLCLIYKPSKSEARGANEADKDAAARALRVLHACRRQPGTTRDGTVDPQAFADFVRNARTLAQEHDRLEVCDVTLGEIMAHAPEGASGIWPFEIACDVLEQIGSQKMLNGFRVGCFNKRGMSSRGACEGGDQERDLADYYRKHAIALEQTHPRLAATLTDLARSYDRDGIREDQEARLRQERH